MTRTLSVAEFAAQAPALAQAVAREGGPVYVEEGEKVVAVLVSSAEYEQMRAIRRDRALAAMNTFSDAVAASGASEEDLQDLVRALDRKA